jgi:hypothetical protein
MITFLFAFTGAMVGAMCINYIIQGPQRFEDDN